MTFRLLACVAFLVALAESAYDDENTCYEYFEDYHDDTPPAKDFYENPWGEVPDKNNKTFPIGVARRYATLDHACGRYCGYMAESVVSNTDNGVENTLVNKQTIFKECVQGITNWETKSTLTEKNDGVITTTETKWFPMTIALGGVEGNWDRPTDCDAYVPETCKKNNGEIKSDCLKSKSGFFKQVKWGELIGNKRYPNWKKPSLLWMLDYEALDYLLCDSIEIGSTLRDKSRCDWGYTGTRALDQHTTCDMDSKVSCCGVAFEGELATQPQAMTNESNGVAAMVVVAVAAVAGIVGVVGMALKKGSITKPMTTTDV